MRKLSRGRIARAAVAAIGAGALGCAAPAVAAACSSGAVSEPFAQFGDYSSYVPLPGGTFEAGAPGWSLVHASIAGENSAFKLPGGSHSLAVAAGGEAVSPAICVNVQYPTFRFFERQMKSQWNWGVLTMSVRYLASNGKQAETVVGSLQGDGSWEPSPSESLATALPLWSGSADMSVQLVFRAMAGGGAFEIDDLYVDPYSR